MGLRVEQREGLPEPDQAKGTGDDLRCILLWAITRLHICTLAQRAQFNVGDGGEELVEPRQIHARVRLSTQGQGLGQVCVRVS